MEETHCEQVGRAFYLVESGVASVIVADEDGKDQALSAWPQVGSSALRTFKNNVTEGVG